MSISEFLTKTTLELCQISSVTKHESELAHDIFYRCQGLGNKVQVKKVGNAVIANGPFLSHRPTFALLGHLDTVPHAKHQKMGIFPEEGRVYGCGASDMKGGLAVMLALLKESFVHDHPYQKQLIQEESKFNKMEVTIPVQEIGSMVPACNIRCIFYDKEEGPVSENGLGPLIQRGALSGVDFGICLEPTDHQIQAGCLGGLQATITFMGKRAHSARPWQGENAIYKALPFLSRLKDFGKKEVWVKGLPFYEVINPTLAQAGIARNVIPDQFVLNVNYRFAPGKSQEQALQEIKDLLKEEGHIMITDQSPSGEVCSDHPLLQSWQKKLGLEVVAKQAWTDVAQLTHHGIPAINFGPGETAQAHQENESIPIKNLEKNYQALYSLLFQNES